MKYDARRTALNILNKFDKNPEPIDKIISNEIDACACFSKKDMALLHALVYGILRWQKRLDWIIKHFSNTRLRKINPLVLNILRLGIFQLCFLNKIPSSAAVNTSVEMAKTFAPPWVVKYVNGLLRNCSRRHDKVTFPNINENPVAALATSKSFPEWLIQRWLNSFGINKTSTLCDVINNIPPITVRSNTLKTTRLQLIKALEPDVENIEKTKYAPDGICFYKPKKSIDALETFQKGWFQVQDEAAQIVTLLLNPKPGETVLDACAGLGGKTSHIAQAMKNQGNIVALDIDSKKLLQLSNAMNRLGISIVNTYAHDLSFPLQKTLSNKFPALFDRILLDSPCSGLGVIRRNPDTKWLLSKKNLIYYSKREKTFLDNLAHLVKPSGILAYAVCSFEQEENEEVVNYFLEKHSEFEVNLNFTGLSQKVRSLLNKNGYFKSIPHINNMDGFFTVCFKRFK